MLSLIVFGNESYDEEKNEFLIGSSYHLELEHSLVALSKWESIYKKPFLSMDQKTPMEMFTYVKCMAVHPRVPEEVFLALDNAHLRQINEYMNESQTATWVKDSSGKSSGQVITSELIYYWLAAFGLSIELQHWHMSRLFMTLKVAAIEGQPKKPMSRSEQMAQHRAQNEKFRAMYEPA